MNPRAIDDLLCTVLSTFYRSAAAWMPPGRLSDHTCTICATSLLSEAVEVGRWPHELMHDLARSLETVAAQIADAYDDEEPNPDAVDGFAAIAVVRAAIAEHSADILDVLRECVEPRLEEYLAVECARGLGEATQWPQGHLG